MSEPITLYDVHGNPHAFVAPSEAHAQVIAGLLFEQPPAVPVPTPDDTQEVPAVATGRARRKQQGAGVL